MKNTTTLALLVAMAAAGVLGGRWWEARRHEQGKGGGDGPLARGGLEALVDPLRVRIRGRRHGSNLQD